jgi:hypothetical protein
MYFDLGVVCLTHFPRSVINSKEFVSLTYFFWLISLTTSYR